MTYSKIRAELLELSEHAKTETPDLAALTRARELVGMLSQMGISPRRVRLSLRQLGLSTRQQEEDRSGSDPTS